MWFDSMNRSNLVLCPPVRKNIGTSFTCPITSTLAPGFVLFSVNGDTRSFFRSTFILFGCSPPSSCSGTSSSTIICASLRSLLIILNFPFRPQLHLVGSWNLLSSCSMLNTFPQLGHSNLAEATCGLTSLLFLTTPSNASSLFIALLLISLTIIFALAGSPLNLSVNPLISFPMFSCSTASSPALIISSGWSSNRSAISGSCIAKTANSTVRLFSPFRILSSI